MENNMRANPEKFQAIAIGSKSHSQNFSFNFGDITVACDHEVKLLGVTVDYLLNFNTHISLLCKKASRQLNVLKRIGKYLNLQCKIMVYHSFILANFSYCPLIWHFCSAQNTKKMEKIQERALRFIYNDYISDCSTLLEKSKLPTLHVRRIQSMAIETFKLVNKQGPIYLHDIIKIKNNHYSFRYSAKAEIPQVRTSRYGLSSFRYSAAKLWNDLPNHFRSVSSFGLFKTMIKSWNGADCTCIACR